MYSHKFEIHSLTSRTTTKSNNQFKFQKLGTSSSTDSQSKIEEKAIAKYSQLLKECQPILSTQKSIRNRLPDELGDRLITIQGSLNKLKETHTSSNACLQAFQHLEEIHHYSHGVITNTKEAATGILSHQQPVKGTTIEVLSTLKSKITEMLLMEERFHDLIESNTHQAEIDDYQTILMDQMQDVRDGINSLEQIFPTVVAEETSVPTTATKNKKDTTRDHHALRKNIIPTVLTETQDEIKQRPKHLRSSLAMNHTPSNWFFDLFKKNKPQPLQKKPQNTGSSKSFNNTQIDCLVADEVSIARIHPDTPCPQPFHGWNPGEWIRKSGIPLQKMTRFFLGSNLEIEGWKIGSYIPDPDDVGEKQLDLPIPIFTKI